MSNQFDLPTYPELFGSRAEAEERVRFLTGIGGIFEIQQQPTICIRLYPSVPDECQERFLVVRLA